MASSSKRDVKHDVKVLAAATGAGTLVSFATTSAGWPLFWTLLTAFTFAVIGVAIDAQITLTQKRFVTDEGTTTLERVLSFGRRPSEPPGPAETPTPLVSSWRAPD